MGQIERIGHVLYRVTDVPASIAFYTNLLGLTLRHSDGAEWAVFDVGGQNLALERTDKASDRGGGATACLRTQDLIPWVARLRESGVEVEEPRQSAHEYSVGVRDLDGNLLLLYEPLTAPT